MVNRGPVVVTAERGGGGICCRNGEAELLRDHFLNWLAEWGREVRRRQTGLMLLTAHRAKGLEFDHVAVLDGGWDQQVRGRLRCTRRLY